MRIAYLLVCSLLFAFRLSFAAKSTNQVVLCTYSARHYDYEWRIGESAILGTPDWKIEKRRVPLQPDKAWRIAQEWFKKRGEGPPHLLTITIRPFQFEPYLRASPELKSKYYYRIECVPAPLDSMLVIVLMDGTVVEPIRLRKTFE